jgi:Fuc2NAc and GlcNAc transferase
MINLFNFMDGIDGLAALEAIVICLCAVILYLLHGYTQLIYAPLGIVSAVTGFLYWNFPPAKIFMGDAGSGFLGVILGFLSLQAYLVDNALIWSWLILLGVFLVDATVTLIRRALSGQKVWQAHCTHAYQYASRQFGRHRPITLGIGLINIFWLFPCALTAVSYQEFAFILTVVAYTPLVALAFFFNAGKGLPDLLMVNE